MYILNEFKNIERERERKREREKGKREGKGRGKEWSSQQYRHVSITGGMHSKHSINDKS
jgi:hypothetical protein